MNLQEKLELFKEKGWTYNQITGDIFSHTGKLIEGKDGYGYTSCSISFNKSNKKVLGHQLAYYLTTGELPDIIDHLDGNRSNNIFTNLSNGNRFENQHNQRNAKGYHFNKTANKWRARIVVNNKQIQLGLFEKEEDAREAYLKAKEIYHPTKAYLFK